MGVVYTDQTHQFTQTVCIFQAHLCNQLQRAFSFLVSMFIANSKQFGRENSRDEEPEKNKTGHCYKGNILERDRVTTDKLDQNI